ncbi:MAG: hypothetical protein M3173_04170 [Chloroflexota bacterium]|nr:hypothetical protein [Chloroflexota bacterium]
MRRSVATLIATALLLTVSAIGGTAAQDTAENAYLGRFQGMLVGSGAPVEGGRCPALTIEITGPGMATHMGSFTTEQSHCVDPTADDPLAFSDGQYTFTDADGSSISGRYNGRLIPTETTGVDGLYLIEGRWTIDEGTGRFEGATGAGVADGLQNLTTGEASLVLDGVFAYPGLVPGATEVSEATPVS